MALGNFRIEAGLEIYESNSLDGIHIIQGDGIPPGTSGPTDDAPIGSLYADRTNSLLYRKQSNTSSAIDWQRFTDEGVYTLIGTAFDASDLGTFTGATISDNATVKQALQDLETALEAISGAAVAENNNVTTPVVLDSCLVDECFYAEWELFMVENGAQGNRRAIKITAMHDGSLDGTVDATITDVSKHTRLQMGANNGWTYDIGLSGAGGAQAMELTVSATNAATFKSRRTDIL